MPSNTYKCSGCGFTEEYIEGAHTSIEMQHPEICPQCNVEKLEKVFDLTGHSIGIDFVGPGFYINDSGIHAWKKRMSLEDQSKVLSGQKDPY
jgi:predicted nucleic acid-binding Zn ribbon protein